MHTWSDLWQILFPASNDKSLDEQVQTLPSRKTQNRALETTMVEHQTKQLMATKPLQAMLPCAPTPIGMKGPVRPGGGLTWATRTD